MRQTLSIDVSDTKVAQPVELSLKPIGQIKHHFKNFFNATDQLLRLVIMLYKALSISTLVALALVELTTQALANPNLTNSTQKNHVVTVEAATTESQNTNNVVVTATPNSDQSTAVQPLPPANETAARAGSNQAITDDFAVTATDVQIVGVSEELQQVIRKQISTYPGGSTSQSQLEKDVAAILNTGLFADARATPANNQQGWDVVYQVTPVVVKSVQLSGNQVLPPEIANDLFQSQLGNPISPTNLNQGAAQLNQWYQDNGYAIAQVIAVQPTANGVVKIEVAEGVIGDINLRFLDEEGKPTEGRTREDFLKDDLQLKSGDLFRMDVAQQDLRQLYLYC